METNSAQRIASVHHEVSERIPPDDAVQVCCQNISKLTSKLKMQQENKTGQKNNRSTKRERLPGQAVLQIWSVVSGH